MMSRELVCFNSSPGDSNMQPRLRITDIWVIQQWLHINAFIELDSSMMRDIIYTVKDVILKKMTLES